MSSDAGVLKPGEEIKAKIDKDSACRLVELRYGLVVKKIVELDAYDDRNFRILCEDRMPFGNPHVSAIAKDGYVLKIVNSLDSRQTGFTDAQTKLLSFLEKQGFNCPIPIKQKDGSYYSVEKLGEVGKEKKHILRLLKFHPGIVFDQVPSTPELLKKVGQILGKLDKAMEGFSHPEYDSRVFLWALTSLPQVRDFFFALDNDEERNFAEKIISTFEQKVMTILSDLNQGIIHGDLNENNMILSPDGKEIEAIIDFGDSIKSYYVFELAICVCYMICQSKSIEMVKSVIEGYQEIKQLTPKEKEILKLCVCARFIMSIVIGSYSYQKEPDNHYLILQHATKWKFVKELWSISDSEIMKIWGLN